ncbi:class A beta-lactamase-related serine hydrolase [Methylolobus aquaticus]|nr:class A beta-lactamase-related serine hydrolase [Methylolobus aquaticus]
MSIPTRASPRSAWLVLFGALALSLIPPPCLARHDIRRTLSAAVDAAWAQVRTPGLQVRIDVPGRGSWTFVRGNADVEMNRPMRAGMQQPIGSITKTMTGTLILQLVEKGKLSLDDTLSRWYPEAPEGDRITIGMLLNMSSGIADFENGRDETDNYIKDLLLKNPRHQFDIDEFIALGLSLDREFDPPGSKFGYTNTATELLGRIAEKVTGRTYEQLLKRRLWRPLNMTRTFLNMRGGLQAPHARLYSPNVIPGQTVNVTRWGLSFSWAAGAVASTLSDLHRWATALGTGQGVLRPETQALRSQYCAPPWGPPSKNLGLTSYYCLGSMVFRDSKDRVVAYWHNGEIWGATAMLAYFPLTGATYVGLANSDDESGGNTAPVAAMQNALMAAPELFGVAP